MKAETSTAPTCVYRCYDIAGHLLYVGITYNVPTRFIHHEYRSPWYGALHTFTEQWYPTRQEASAEERRAILSENPRWNVQGALPAIENADSLTGRIAQVIQAELASAGMSPHLLCARSGISAAVMRRKLSNSRRFNVNEVASIAEALNTTPLALILAAEELERAAA